VEKLAKISRERKDSTSFFFERREYAITFGIPCTSLFMSPDIAGPYVMCKRQKEERERDTGAFPNACSLVEGRRRRRCSAAAPSHRSRVAYKRTSYL